MNVVLKPRPAWLALSALLFTGASAFAEPDVSTHVQITPPDLKWMPAKKLPPGTQTAVVLGDPKGEGVWTVRMKFPPKTIVPAHTHPNDRSVTVIAGTFNFGNGDKYDPAKLRPLPPGSVVTEPKDHQHFVSAGDEEVIIQITAQGPNGINYVNPADAPAAN
jgi:quercetin dioxygenase-like cupin family protein